MRGSAFLPRAVLLFGAALLPAQGKPDPAALVRKMGTAKDNNQRYQAYLALLRSKPPGAIPLLERSLPTFTGPALTYGVSLLRSYPDQAGFPALRRLMKAGPSLLSFYCAETLFRAGEKAALPFLRKALEGASDLSSRISMSARIQGLKDEGIQALVRSWVRPEADAALLRSALTYLFSVKDRGTAENLKGFLAEGKTAPQAKAFFAAFLVAGGDRGAGKALAEALSTEKVPLSAYYTITRFLKQGPRPPREVMEALLSLLKEEKRAFFLTSIMEVFEKFPFRPALPVLRKLLEDDNPTVARSAFDALAAFPGALGPAALRRLLTSKNPDRRLLAADTLRRMDDPSGLEAVLELARRRGPHRERAMEVLAKFRANKAVPPLIEALDDPDQAVRRTAFYGLRTILTTLFPYRRLDLSSTGYDPSAPAAKRRAGAALIRAWWEKNKDKDW